MHVELLTAGLMEPFVGPAIPAQVLWCDTGEGAVLVDTGFGRADLADPDRRIGPLRRLLRPRLDPSLTVAAQLEARGVDPSAVTDIVLTHLDLDHVGGADDFPDARIHTTAEEFAAAIRPDRRDRARYRQAQLTPLPDPVTYAGRGDVWRYGLTGHEVRPGLVLVPMPGHSRGHAAVAVEHGERWVIHAGDAMFDASQLGVPGVDRARRSIRVFERTVGRDQQAISRNHRLLAELAALPEVAVVLAHDDRATLPVHDGG